jgi:hypothetical protein
MLFQKKSVPEPTLSELQAALLAETQAAFGPDAQPEPSVRDRLAWLRAEAERARPLFLLGMVLGPLAYVLATGHFERFAAGRLGSSVDACS